MVEKLIEQIQPSHYDLEITVDLENFSYTLGESIIFYLVKPTTTLTFHASNITIGTVNIADIKPVSIEFDTQKQTVSFVFTDPLSAGSHTLHLKASGIIQDSLHGFYRSRYEKDGKTHYLATTQFEAIHAREAIVCIDEPAAKASFDVSLVVPDHLTALSNGEIVSVTTMGMQKMVKFETTPKMSSYLLAFIIGEFESIEGKDSKGTDIRVFATPGKSSQLNFALDIAIRSLDFYADYFGLEYPLSKLDMVAIPDFASGAMENWGLVTYRETDLLIDPERSSLSNRQRVTEVVAHELAHQWFGNLVTMEWWNDLWLNESFASWVETLASDHFFPEWKYWSVFTSTLSAYALDLDALANSHPIEVAVTDPAALDEIFDGISYWKGASVIRMLEAYLGEDAFREGLRIYLKRHAYGSAQTADLWSALEEASGEPVGKIMSSWTTQMGYPVISVSATDSTTVFKQERFYSSSAERERAENSSLWSVPLNYQIDGDGTVHKSLLVERSTELETHNYDWIKLNPSKVGFYRARYEGSLQKNLIESLAKKNSLFLAEDRYDIVADSFALAEADMSATTEALEIIATFKHEDDYIVWQAILGGLSSLIGLFDYTSDRQKIESFGRDLTASIVERIGWTPSKNENPFTTLLRPLVLAAAGSWGSQTVIAEAKRMFAARVESPISSDLEGTVYGIVGRYADANDYDSLLELFRNTDQAQAKQRVRQALTRSNDLSMLARTLDLALSDEVRSQDSLMVIGGVMMNFSGTELAWRFIEDNWQVLEGRYGEGGKMLDNIPAYAGHAFNRINQADMVSEFFLNQHPLPVVLRPTKQAVEGILLKNAWYDRDGTAILDWIQDQ